MPPTQISNSYTLSSKKKKGKKIVSPRFIAITICKKTGKSSLISGLRGKKWGGGRGGIRVHEAESTARSIFRGLIQPREIRQLGKPISLADLSAAARKIRLRDLAYAEICVIACWNMDASGYGASDRDLARENSSYLCSLTWLRSEWKRPLGSGPGSCVDSPTSSTLQQINGNVLNPSCCN